MDIVNLAFSSGSSKHGNADLAWVASKCVVAKYLQTEIQQDKVHVKVSSCGKHKSYVGLIIL